MPLQLTAPIEKEFVLEKSDEAYENDGDPTRVFIRQATQSQHERRSHMWSELVQEIIGNREAPDAVRLIQKLNIPELHRLEVYLTMIGCNILGENDEPLFKFRDQKLDMTEHEFKLAWGMLPPLIANEIHEKVMELNVTWSPQGED